METRTNFKGSQILELSIHPFIRLWMDKDQSYVATKVNEIENANTLSRPNFVIARLVYA